MAKPNVFNDLADPHSRPFTLGLAQWDFGQPVIRCDNEGWGKWEKVARNAKYVMGTDANRQFRHGAWAVHLNGGKQDSGEDWASLWIPVNDMPLKEIQKLMWTYYKFLAGTADVGVCSPSLVLTTRNPNNPDERADISQQAAHGALVTAGWHDDTVLPGTTAYLFWYGNNVTSDLTEGSLYTLEDFQQDKAFKDHVVYMIKLDYGYWSGTRATGDVWIGTFEVNEQQIPLVPDLAQQIEVAKFEAEMFGAPTLMTGGSASAGWSRQQFQKGSTGWTACLIGGAQSGDDWAAVFIPVNELPVPLLNTARWSYLMQGAQTMGVNIVIWVHDPLDFDKRAEITQLANIATLEKGAGWNAHELNQTTDQFFYYGEGVANTSLITGAGPGNLFGWDDFQGDECFNTWTIYRISIEYGWEASGTFLPAWVSDICLNEQLIQLKPVLGEHAGTEVKSLYKVTATNSTTKATMLTPTSGMRIRIVSVQAVSGSATEAVFEVYFHTGANIAADTAKAIFIAYLDKALTACARQTWDAGAGPLGAVDDVVSVRTSADVASDGHFVITYREE